MGLDDVTQEILDEAQREAEQIRADAEEQVEEILDEAEEMKQEILDEAQRDVEQEVEALRKKELSNARMDARQTKLAARESVMEDAFDAFRDRVADLGAADERELVAAALDRLDGRLDIGTVTVAGDLEDLAAEYGDVETADIRGAIVESADGTRRFDLRFDAMAARAIEANRKAVAEVLFD